MRKFRSNESARRNATSSMQLSPEGNGGREELRKTGCGAGEGLSYTVLLEEMAQMEMKALTELTPLLMTA